MYVVNSETTANTQQTNKQTRPLSLPSVFITQNNLVTIKRLNGTNNSFIEKKLRNGFIQKCNIINRN